MKTYRHPETGHVQFVDDNAAGQIRALTKAGYEEWDEAAQAKAKEQAEADNEKKLADAQAEVAAGPQRPKPLNPAARGEARPEEGRVVTEGTILPVTEDKPPRSGTVVAEGTTEPQPPKAPAVPKKN